MKKLLARKKQFKTEELIGYLPYILLSKEIFNKNNQIRDFIEQHLHLSFKHYIYASRSLVLAKLTKHIFDLPEENQKLFILSFSEKLAIILAKNNESVEKEEQVEKEEKPLTKKENKKRSKKNTNALENWLNHLVPLNLNIKPADILKEN